MHRKFVRRPGIAVTSTANCNPGMPDDFSIQKSRAPNPEIIKKICCDLAKYGQEQSESLSIYSAIIYMGLKLIVCKAWIAV